MTGISPNIPPKHINSIDDTDGTGKLLNRKVDGKTELIMKYKGEYYVANGNGWEQVQENSGDTMFTKKTFSRMVQSPNGEEVVAVTSSAEQTEECSRVSADSSKEERLKAIKNLSSYNTIINEFNEKNGNMNPIDITNKSNEELANLENGTPVFVTRTNEKGELIKITGRYIDGMVVRERRQYSTLGFENNYTTLTAYDPLAYQENRDSKIGQVALLQDDADYKVE